MKPVRRFVALAFLSAVAVVAAQKVTATTVTFEGLPELLLPPGSPWLENGVTVTGDSSFLGSFLSPGTAHLDDSGTPITSFLNFTMPRRFTPISFDVLGFGTEYVPDSDTCDPDCVAVPYDNVVVAGLRDGVTVFEQRFYAGDPGQVSTYVFPTGANFLVDMLSIRSVLPPGFSPDDNTCDQPCGHFSIDNVELVPIPLPASALLLVGALAAAVGLSGKRRSRTFRAGW